MISDSQPIPSYDRTWQVRLLVLTLLVGIFVGGLGVLLWTPVLMFLRDINLEFLGVGLSWSQILIDIVLVIQLVRRSENVFFWIVIRAIGYALLWGGVFIFIWKEPLGALVWTYLASGISLPLLLLASGTPGRWRRFVALLTLISYVLSVILFVVVEVLLALYGV